MTLTEKSYSYSGPLSKSHDSHTPLPRIAKLRVLFVRGCLVASLPCPGIAATAAAQAAKIVCVGNSITQGSSLPSPETSAYPAFLQKKLGSGYSVGNFGVSGRTLLKKGDHPYWAEAKFAEVFSTKPAIITILLGTNDSKPHNWVHGAEFENDYAAMIDTFSAISTHPKILLCLPSACFANSFTISESVISAQIIPKIEALAAQRGLPVIDAHTPFLSKPHFLKDGVHPDTSGHALLADLFYEGIVNTATNQSPKWRYLWYGSAPGPGTLNGNDSTDKPRLYVFPAPDSIRNGAAVIVCPGGGYDHLSLDKEGYKAAEWFNSLGVTAFVLRSRYSPYRHPVPLSDAKRAMRLVRYYAGRYSIDSTKVGICGFSAGGHLASTLGTHFDAGDGANPDPVERKKSRPDFMVLVYPVITLKGPYAHSGSCTSLLGSTPAASLVDSLSNHVWVTKQTPQTFLGHGDQDKSVPIQNSRMFDSACIVHAVPERLFVDPGKAHGYGLAGAWPAACRAWLEERDLIPGSVGAGQTHDVATGRQPLISLRLLPGGTLCLTVTTPAAYRVAVYGMNGARRAVFTGSGAAEHLWRPPSAGVYIVRGTAGGITVAGLAAGR